MMDMDMRDTVCGLPFDLIEEIEEAEGDDEIIRRILDMAMIGGA